MRLTASSYVRPCRPVRRRNAVSGVYAGLQSSRLRLIRDVRLSHERVGQSITSIRAHGPEKRRLRASLRLQWRLAPEIGLRVLPLQSTCSCPSTPSPRLIRSKASAVDLRRVPARCSIRPVHRSKLQVAMCSSGDASHGLFATSHRAVRQDAREHITRFITESKTAYRAPVCTCIEL